MENKIIEMVELQKKLNDFTNGSDWRNNITKEGKTINWKRAIVLEAGELIDSYPWKWWKSIDKDPDRDNILIETVDIWHFVISHCLSIGLRPDTIATVFTNLDHDTDLHIECTIEEEIESIENLIDTTFVDDNQFAILNAFIHMSKCVGVGMNDLYKTYVGKNVLNIFRQNNGYAEGTYIKEWNGTEDNVYLTNILDSINEVTYDEVYAKLDSVYKELMK